MSATSDLRRHSEAMLVQPLRNQLVAHVLLKLFVAHNGQLKRCLLTYPLRDVTGGGRKIAAYDKFIDDEKLKIVLFFC